MLQPSTECGNCTSKSPNFLQEPQVSLQKIAALKYLELCDRESPEESVGEVKCLRVSPWTIIQYSKYEEAKAYN